MTKSLRRRGLNQFARQQPLICKARVGFRMTGQRIPGAVKKL